MVQIGDALVGVNTNTPNILAKEAIDRGFIEELQGFPSLKKEVKYGTNSRIDILLEGSNGSKCYVEVKNVTMKRNLKRSAPAEFPDGVTSRGLKHLLELSRVVECGHRAVMLYIVQRNDIDSFILARDIDPKYGKAYDDAVKSGVEILSYACQLTPKEINLVKKINVLR